MTLKHLFYADRSTWSCGISVSVFIGVYIVNPHYNTFITSQQIKMLGTNAVHVQSAHCTIYCNLDKNLI